MKTKFFTVSIFIFLCLSCFSQDKLGYKIVLFETQFGDIKVKLFNETPLHRDNFIKLINEGFYDNLLFHRVIKNFMIQTGDPNSRDAKKGQMLGIGNPGYTIPAEINTRFIHKKGVLAAARQGDNVNPSRASSGSQFYVVQGQTYTDQQLDQVELHINSMNQKKIFDSLYISEINKIDKKELTADKKEEIVENCKILTYKKVSEIKPFKYTPEQREIYKSIGGSAHLDAAYTIFGEVIEGMDVVEKINNVLVDKNNRPENDIRIIKAKLLN
ncbi:MAG: peptidylprolyl isomerase [bacterium]